MGMASVSEQQLSCIGTKLAALRELHITDAALGRFGPADINKRCCHVFCLDISSLNKIQRPSVGKQTQILFYSWPAM
eukprot:scaffold247410_cov39-Prasinocladus_malaysianus.AAC.1